MHRALGPRVYPRVLRAADCATSFGAIMPVAETIPNYIGGEWKRSASRESNAVINPATQESLAELPLSTADDVASAVEAAAAAFPHWRRTPPEERIQPLFKLKQLLEDN